MALPKLDIPKYSLVVPSTKKEVEYRPFLVKEEKILMMAEESKDDKQYIQALKDIIIACTFNKLTVDNLTTYDLEYIFLQLRCKSIGENVKLIGRCPLDCPHGENCDPETPITLDLSTVKVREPKVKPNDMIKLTDSVSIKLKPISVKYMSKLDANSDITTTIRYMIDSVYDANNIYDLSDSSDNEVTEFINSFSHEALEGIQEYILKQPKMVHTLKYNCSKCKKENDITIEGFQAFFQ